MAIRDLTFLLSARDLGVEEAFKQVTDRAGTGFDGLTRKLEKFRTEADRSMKLDGLARGVSDASLKVSAAQNAEARTAGLVRVADAQLADARGRYAAESVQVIRAEERLSEVQRQHVVAADLLGRSTGKLQLAQRALGEEQSRGVAHTVEGATAFQRLSAGVGNTASKFAGAIPVVGAAFAAITVGAAAGTFATAKLAGNFQAATTRLVTDAGESARNLKLVQNGLMDIAKESGTSAQEVARGMYLVESAGYHGAQGLLVMKAAAEGAKIGGADLTTVGDALTTVLKDYNIPASQAAATTSKLIATVSVGKTTMEALAGSLHSVLPNAQAAHIGLAEVLGAVGTMTQEGISADQATQNLNHAILSLQSPSAVARNALAAVGLSALDVAKNLGQRGLTGTFQLLGDAVAKHMGGDGVVALRSFNQSAQATSAIKTQIASLPPELQRLGTAFAAGNVTQKAWTKTLSEQPATVRNLGMQFATTVKRATGFSDALKSGEGPQRTFAAQLSKMVGGQTGLQVALHLSGTHLNDFKKNVDAIGSATAQADKHVKGFADTQKTLNFQMSKVTAAFEVAAIKIGTALTPAVMKLLPSLVKLADALAKLAPFFADVIGWVADLTAKFAYGAKQWSDAFTVAGIGWKHLVSGFELGAKQLSSYFGGVTHNFGHGSSQLNGYFNGVVRNFAHGWQQIQSGTSHAWSGIQSGFSHGGQQIGSTVSRAWAGITSGFAHGWSQITTGVSRAWGAITSAFARGFSQIRSAVSSGISGVVSFFSGLPGRVVGALGNLGGLLFSSGQSLIRGFANGITSAIGSAVSAASGVVSAVARFFPHSPALEGPFSGRGWTGYSGQAVGRDFADGMTASAVRARAAARSMMAGVASDMGQTSAYGGAGRPAAATVGTAGSTAGTRQAAMLGARTVIAPEIHIHNPVAVDPVQQTREAAQYALAYAGLG